MQSAADGRKNSEARARGLALQMAVQLPSDPNEARLVVNHLVWLLDNFMDCGPASTPVARGPKLISGGG